MTGTDWGWTIIICVVAICITAAKVASIIKGGDDE